MKANTPELMKFKRLQRRLGESTRGVVGLLEMLWLGCAKNSPRGDIGRFSNEEIAIMVDWDGNHDQLIEALVQCGWIDECTEHRLLVHDWHEHSPKYVKGNVERHFGGFASRKEAPLGMLPKEAPSEAPKRESLGDTPTKPSQAKSNQTKPNQAKPQGFAEWWKAYPRKVGKQDAEKAYATAVCEIANEHSLSVEQAEKELRQWTNERVPHLGVDPQYIPYPAKWLSKGRYKDELVSAEPRSTVPLYVPKKRQEATA